LRVWFPKDPESEVFFGARREWAALQKVALKAAALRGCGGNGFRRKAKIELCVIRQIFEDEVLKLEQFAGNGGRLAARDFKT